MGLTGEPIEVVEIAPPKPFEIPVKAPAAPAAVPVEAPVEEPVPVAP